MSRASSTFTSGDIAREPGPHGRHSTPMGKLVFQIAGAFAEFERTMIRQRIQAGLKRAVAQGVKLGRPKIDSATERKVRKQLAKGVGILKLAKSLGIGTGTVQRISNELG
jgi:DNA invertase Pin-like site-specific DNA recombinase